jgi:hypothetical protein
MKNLLIVIFALLCFVGCRSPQQKTYTTLASIGMSVDKAMHAAAEAKVAGKVSQSDWEKISDAHAKFIVAYSAACDLAAFDYTRFASADLIALSAKLIKTVDILLK